jgi:hypothetical protein
VHWYRGAVGAGEGNRLDLLHELTAVPAFARLWADEQVAFRRERKHMQLRDPRTGAPYSVFTELYRTMPDSPDELYVYLGVRLPYNGPPL